MGWANATRARPRVASVAVYSAGWARVLCATRMEQWPRLCLRDMPCHAVGFKPRPVLRLQGRHRRMLTGADSAPGILARWVSVSVSHNNWPRTPS